MKKFFLFALMLGLTVSLTACGSDGADGAAGLKGDTGDTGDTGPTGPTGPGAGLYDFKKDVLPLFTTAGAFYSGSTACTATGCHDAATGAHELDMRSYNGIIAGADGTFVSVLGQSNSSGSVGGAGSAQHPSLNGVDWDHSKMKGRLRDNRMPPGWTFDSTEANRSTPEINLIVQWMDDGAPATQTATTGSAGARLGYNSILSDIKPNASGKYGVSDVHTGTAPTWQLAGATTIQGLFTTAGAFYSGSQACSATGCHDSATGAHELDLTTYAGLTAGADGTGVSVLGQKNSKYPYAYGATGSATTPTYATGTDSDPNSGKSKMKDRLRNNRMPPGWTFDSTEANRSTPEINLVGAWIKSGAYENVPFTCSNCPDAN